MKKKIKNKTVRKVKEKKEHPELFEFNKIRKQLLFISVISIVTTFIALAIVGLKIFYPFHLFIGLSIYVISFIPTIRRIYLSRKTWKRYRAYKFSEKFFKKEKKRLIVAVIFIICTICFLWLRPLDQNPFSEYSDEQIKTLVTDDLYKSVTAMDYLETTGTTLLSKLETAQPQANNSTQIIAAFDEFTKAVAYSESLSDVHRYFGSIPYGMWDERQYSFMISYSLYIKKYEIVHRIMQNVSNDEYKKKLLNHHMKSVDKSNVYNEMVVRFYEPKTRLRLTIGYIYMNVFNRPELDDQSSYTMLHQKSIQSYLYLKNNFFKTILQGGEVVLDQVETKMFDRWFPVQKTVAITMGRTILSTRGKNGLITEEDALNMQTYMEPGDIMLQRRNWHVSNVGIPGFWTHSALYTGDLEIMNTYFASEFPYKGAPDFSSYLQEQYPDVYQKYTEKDSLGYANSVIEAIEPGVIIQSLPRSTDADFVVVLRPKLLSKKDKMEALFETFNHFGKPYDFNFDFDTLDSLVCSELIYNSYLEGTDKKGVYFETSLINGRKMVSPLDIAKKFKNEYGTKNAELEFVYLLESNEKTGKSYIGDIDTFLDSVNWSKFTFLK